VTREQNVELRALLLKLRYSAPQIDGLSRRYAGCDARELDSRSARLLIDGLRAEAKLIG
jgi:hypothetical protein